MNYLILNSGPGAPAFNMALDEALLEAALRLRNPVLRFYSWTQPAATFGYFQKYAEVGRATRLRPLVRRPTGGGIVPHDTDWTYSLVAPPNNEWHSLKAEESYRRIHEWIQFAFEKLEIITELAAFCKKSVAGQCFAGHEKYDLLWQGRKIAGAAQRRNKLGLLIQGSVQPPPVSLARPDWEEAMRVVARTKWKIEWNELLPDRDLLCATEKSVREKYSQKDYNQRR